MIMHNKLLYRFISIIITFSLLITGCSNKNSTSSNAIIKENINDKLIIHYINVGQGDSELIQYKGKNMLIDSGPFSSKNILMKYLKSAGIRKLDYVIVTHPHEDHIGNMSDIIKEFEISEFIAPKISSNSSTYSSMIKNLKSKKLKITVAKPGYNIDLHPDLKCEILAPNNTTYDNINNYSVVNKLTYKNTSFLFTGDAENLSENEMIQKNYNLKANIIKLGHHGSNTASSNEFLKKVNPSVAIISCAKKNKYNHPSPETVKKLKKMNIKLYRTDIDGNIILFTDGDEIKKLNK